MTLKFKKKLPEISDLKQVLDFASSYFLIVIFLPYDSLSLFISFTSVRR